MDCCEGERHGCSPRKSWPLGLAWGRHLETKVSELPPIVKAKSGLLPLNCLCRTSRGHSDETPHDLATIAQTSLPFLCNTQGATLFLTHPGNSLPQDGPIKEIPHLSQAAYSIFPDVLIWIVEIQELQRFPGGQFGPNLQECLKLFKIKTGSEVWWTKVTYLSWHMGMEMSQK